ncbi:DUF1189 family protein [Macrococcoides caseolyticum]|uniref:DUF1189 family protein n=1 Tax=Macrococcoides caseolyticum TaxID=69966 RepID=UPI001F45C76F|nr:DUF1189 family protein [Macrococcus caseolyticus]MCE4956126.1 DUF1189 family protein [Macrococcus caseolyticus]
MYFKHLKRIFHPQSYPLFRTVKLRYIFLHLLIIAILFSIPNGIKYFNIIQIAHDIIDLKQSEIPDFQINDNVLHINKDKKIEINNYSVLFTNHSINPAHHLIIFSKNGIQIENTSFIPYNNIPLFSDKTSLVQFLETFTASRYFYFALIVSFFVFIQFISTIIKIIVMSTFAHGLSIVLKRKSRFMNWLKINTFIITVPSIILVLSLFLPEFTIFTMTLSWVIYLILIFITIYHLPKQRKINFI